ncbi:MAG TPA: hypothetical protein VGQ41_10080 [Pyrinomonadaceae bacterium]|jgi:hypothetical protein|nr:hypothetical protein [Pyrinomonadaceae bacterium]
MKKLLLALLLIILATGGIFLYCRRQSHPVETAVVSPDECIKRAEESLARWRQEKKPQDQIEKLYQAELARCGGTRNGAAEILGAANFDYTRLGRLFLTEHLNPADYLARVRDRSRKVQKAIADDSWSQSYLKGDRDNDLIPDERDRCPDTPDLVPTDDSGCPQNEPLPAAPSIEEVRRAKEGLQIVISPACKDAPLPSLSEPLQIGRDSNDQDSFLISVTRVNNQPAGCMVFYEISLHLKRSSFFGGLRESDARVVFRTSENIDTSAAAAQRHVFRIKKSTFPLWNDLISVAIEPNDIAEKHVKVRAISGNGLSSGWSAPKIFSMRFNNTLFPN